MSSQSSSSSASTRPLRIGMFGGGTVGGGVYEIIMGRLGGSKDSSDSVGAISSSSNHQQSECTNKRFRKCIISKICVRDLAKPRSFHIDDDETKLVTDYKSIIDDASIDLVVEVMGGTGLAKTVVLESLKNGKSVVTANKALIAEHLDEIKDAVSKTNGKAVFAYEAAVCGGIPIIQALQR
jgi:homoserine dehydrogenase